MDTAQALRRLHTGLGRLDETVKRLERIKKYREGDHDDPYTPPGVSQEYIQLRDISKANILPLVAGAPLQRLRVSGYESREDSSREAAAAFWRETWQHNRMDQRQAIVHADAVWYGRGITAVSPGSNPKRPRITVESPFRVHIEMDPEDQFKPLYAVKRILDESDVTPSQLLLPSGLTYRPRGEEKAWVYDETHTYSFRKGEKGWEQVGEPKAHNLGSVPFVPYDVDPNSDGVPRSLMEPLIPAQDALNFARFAGLLALQFAAYNQRAVSGYDPILRDDEGEVIYRKDANGEEIIDPNTGLRVPLLASMGRPGVDRLWTFSSKDVKIHDFKESNIEYYINFITMLLQDIMTRGQVPPQYLQMSLHNATGEALTGAEAPLSALVGSLKSSFAESHEQTLRLCRSARGEDSDDMSSEATWEAAETRSHGQIIDGIVKLVGTGFPRREAWATVPGMTAQKLNAVMDAYEKELSSRFDSLVG